MTQSQLLELCKQHFAFLGRLSQVTKVRDIKTKKWVSSRKVIEEECLAAIKRIENFYELGQ